MDSSARLLTSGDRRFDSDLFSLRFRIVRSRSGNRQEREFASGGSSRRSATSRYSLLMRYFATGEVPCEALAANLQIAFVGANSLRFTRRGAPLCRFTSRPLVRSSGRRRRFHFQGQQQSCQAGPGNFTPDQAPRAVGHLAFTTGGRARASTRSSRAPVGRVTWTCAAGFLPAPSRIRDKDQRNPGLARSTA